MSEKSLARKRIRQVKWSKSVLTLFSACMPDHNHSYRPQLRERMLNAESIEKVL